MEKLSNIIKDYNNNQFGQNKQYEDVKKLLGQANISYTSFKIQASTIIFYVPNHIEATELKYKQNYLLKVLKSQSIKAISVRAKD